MSSVRWHWRHFIAHGQKLWRIEINSAPGCWFNITAFPTGCVRSETRIPKSHGCGKWRFSNLSDTYIFQFLWLSSHILDSRLSIGSRGKWNETGKLNFNSIPSTARQQLCVPNLRINTFPCISSLIAQGRVSGTFLASSCRNINSIKSIFFMLCLPSTCTHPVNLNSLILTPRSRFLSRVKLTLPTIQKLQVASSIEPDSVVNIRQV